MKNRSNNQERSRKINSVDKLLVAYNIYIYIYINYLLYIK